MRKLIFGLFLALSAVTVSFPSIDAHAQTVPTISTSHSDHVNQLAFSPDGRWLASGGDDRSVKLWNIATGQMLRSIDEHPGKIAALAISPDGQRIATSYLFDDKTIKVWRSDTGALLKTLNLPDPQAQTDGLAFAADGTLIANAYRQIYRFDIDGGPKTGPVGRAGAQSYFPTNMALSPDGKLIAFVYSEEKSRIRTAIFNAATGAQIRTLDSPASPGLTRDIRFSPDGRLLAVPKEKAIRIWDLSSGNQRTLSSDQDVSQVAWGLDGSRLYSVGSNHGIDVWDVARGTVQKRIKSPSSDDDGADFRSAIAVSPDGKTIATATIQKQIDLWDAATGAPIRTMEGNIAVQTFSNLESAPHDQWAVPIGGQLRFWSSETGQLVRNIPSDVVWRLSTRRADDKGRWLQAYREDAEQPNGSYKAFLKLWDANSEREVASIADDGLAVAIAPNGRYVATGTSHEGEKFHKIYDTATGKQVWTLPTPWASVSDQAFSPDGRYLVADGSHSKDKGAQRQAFNIWDMSNGQLIKSVAAGKDDPSFRCSYSPDGSHILAASYNAMRLFDSGTGRVVWDTKPAGDVSIKATAFSPDGKSIVSGDQDGTQLTVWDASSGRPVRTLAGNPGRASSILFVQGGRKIVTGNANRTGGVWDAQSGQLLVTVVYALSGEWVTITPEGFFVASEHGAQLLHIVSGFDATGIDQVYQALYRPDLVREKLAGDPRGLVREAAARLDLNKVIASGSAPDVRLSSSGNAPAVSVDAEVTNRGGGIGRIEWRVNGVTAAVDAAPANAPSPLRLSRSLALAPGSNTVEVVAYNSVNLVASPPVQLTVATQGAAPGADDKTARRLFVLAAGSDKYADQRFQLQYSVRDAKSMAQAFVDSGKGLYESVDVKVLSDGEVTARNLDAAFQDLSKKVRPTDVFVLYLAGHGKTVDGRYYFIPQPFKIDGKLTTAGIDSAVVAQGINQEQWQRWLALVPASRSVILFDTCESGTLTDESLTKSLEQGAANDRLAQATGRTIMTASSGSTEAFEGFHGHGLFTYNLLDALGRGDGDRNGTIEVSELAAFVYAQVTSASEQVFKKRQEPQIKINLNYALARQTRVLDDDVPLIASGTQPAVHVAQQAQLQIKPTSGATIVRSLSPQTPLTVIRSENGWSLIASEGKPVGYVATRDLAPIP